jgi:hypothetical protein
MTRLPPLHLALLRSPQPLPGAVITELLSLVPKQLTYADQWVVDLMCRPETTAEQAAALYAWQDANAGLPGTLNYWGRAEHSTRDLLQHLDTGSAHQRPPLDLLVEVLDSRWCADRDSRFTELAASTDPDNLVAVLTARTAPAAAMVAAGAQLDLLAAARSHPRTLLRGDRVRRLQGALARTWVRDPETAAALMTAVSHLPDLLTEIVEYLPSPAPPAVLQAVVDALITLLGRKKITESVRDMVEAITADRPRAGSPLITELSPGQRAALHSAACTGTAAARTRLSTGAALTVVFAPADQVPLAAADPVNPDVAAWLLTTCTADDPDWPVLLPLARTFTGTLSELVAVTTAIRTAAATTEDRSR